MKKKIVIFATSLVLLLLLPKQSTRADEISDLKQMLKEQNQMLLEMQQRIEQLKTTQKTQEQNVDEKISKAVESKQVSVPEVLNGPRKSN